jgi:hypothetical protein
MHSAFGSKLAYKLFVKAFIDPQERAMGGSFQGWVKMWWGEGHRVRACQLGVRRVPELDRVNCSGTGVASIQQACQVFNRSKSTEKWNFLGFFYIHPLYEIKPGGEPPANGQRWTLCISNGVYYHSTRIAALAVDAWVQRNRARIEKKKKRADDAFVQRLLEENMESDDEEQAAPSGKRLCVQPGNFKLAISGGA